MRINRIKIINFRNFANFEVTLRQKNIIIVGENNSGKSNLLYALRLVLDTSLPNSARYLEVSDFWDGLNQPFGGNEIKITIEFGEFNENPLEQASLTNCFEGSATDLVASISYIFAPKEGKDIEHNLSLSEDDYDFYYCCNENPSRKIRDISFQKNIPFELLQPLRNANADLESWQRSPLSRLIKRLDVDRSELQKLGEEIDKLIENILDLPPIEALQTNIVTKLEKMLGQTEAVDPLLGFLQTDPDRLLRFLRLFADGEARRSLDHIGTGYANILYLILFLLDSEDGQSLHEKATTILAIEEPEAHLHPHLQRLVFRDLFDKGISGMPLLISTHSPHITSVAPLKNLLLLRKDNQGTVGKNVINAGLSETEIMDLERYLDVTRSELVFSKGIILVEGIAEQILINEYANLLGKPLDVLGISIININGIDFYPYVMLLSNMGFDIPTVTVTDGDPYFDKSGELCFAGIERGKGIYEVIHHEAGLIEGDIEATLAKCGIFVGEHTLEIDLIDAGYGQEFLGVFEDLGEGRRSIANTAQVLEDWASFDMKTKKKKIVAKIEKVCGKGRFAQRIASKLDVGRIPPYILQALNFFGIG